MDPRELLRELMRRHGDNPYSLARKLNGRPSQPRIHAYLSSVSKEPRRSTMAPIAAHYGISIDALYDPVVAEIAVRELDSPGGANKGINPTQVGKMKPSQKLAALFDLMASDLDEQQAYRAASAAVIDALRELQDKGSGASSGAR